jgi:hypothetical protein
MRFSRFPCWWKLFKNQHFSWQFDLKGLIQLLGIAHRSSTFIGFMELCLSWNSILRLPTKDWRLLRLMMLDCIGRPAVGYVGSQIMAYWLSSQRIWFANVGLGEAPRKWIGMRVFHTQRWERQARFNLCQVSVCHSACAGHLNMDHQVSATMRADYIVMQHDLQALEPCSSSIYVRVLLILIIHEYLQGQNNSVF